MFSVEVSSLRSCECFFFRGVSVVFWLRNGDAIRTTGGGGDGLNETTVGSLSIDGGDGDMSINSLGECIGDGTRRTGFFSSFVELTGFGNDLGLVGTIDEGVVGFFGIGFVGFEVGTGIGVGFGFLIIFSCWWIGCFGFSSLIEGSLGVGIGCVYDGVGGW